MLLQKFGDRGPSITQLQQSLNAWPTQLAKLACDGIFGKHTQARVLEFQRDRHLAADGLVGPATMAALLKPPPGGEEFVSYLLQSIAAPAMHLPLVSRPHFDSQCRKLVEPLRTPVPIGTDSAKSQFIGMTIPWQLWYLSTPQGQAFMVLIVLMTVMISLLLSSSDPRAREKGIGWQRELERLKGTAGEKTPDVAMAEAYGDAKSVARDLIESKAEALEPCKDSNLKPTPRCKEALELIDRLKRELFEKFRKPVDKFPGLMQGISRNSTDLIAAYRDASIYCNRCGDLA